MRDRSQEKETDALTAVRTVHSRALTGLDQLEQGNIRMDGEYAWNDGDFLVMQDEDYEEMRAALEKVVELLAPWKKAGARRRRR